MMNRRDEAIYVFLIVHGKRAFAKAGCLRQPQKVQGGLGFGSLATPQSGKRQAELAAPCQYTMGFWRCRTGVR